MSTGLLVSVRSVTEAVAARAGGASLIDVKEPANGPLGAARPHVMWDILNAVGGGLPVSAALGELIDGGKRPIDHDQLTHVKWGLSGYDRWPAMLDELAERRRELASRLTVVAVAYADWQRAAGPSPAELVPWAINEGFRVFLFDTWGKDGSSLLDWATMDELREWCGMLNAGGVRCALAGSIGLSKIESLMPLRPDWFAVRGAACVDGDRGGAIDEARVRRLADRIAGSRK